MSGSPRSIPDWFSRLIEDARAADGVPPFSDQSLVDYRMHTRELVAIDELAAALHGKVDAEFVVDPDARGRGLGATLLEALLAGGATLFWAHGDAPAARALAASHGLVAVRELLHLVGEVPPSGRVAVDAGGGVIETFLPTRDEQEWVTLNAITFANHPEQGLVTLEDVRQLETEPWFRADNFLVLRRGGRMIGYCWLKVEDGRGEFYVVGVSPDHHGEGLGSLLFDAGLARLRELGIRSSHLYVEADNAPALRLYRSRGFGQDSIDVQYRMSAG
ncbi:MAG TPA: mycothiol synthase [Galbitalea sp.]|jgi:mycothiol synthase|nr:mycothiol synthase [Galbitalea sp.]